MELGVREGWFDGCAGVLTTGEGPRGTLAEGVALVVFAVCVALRQNVNMLHADR